MGTKLLFAWYGKEAQYFYPHNKGLSMRLMNLFRHGCLLCCLTLILLLTACDALPTVSIGPTSQTPTPTINTWNKAAPGVEVRSETWKSPSNSLVSATVRIVRFDLHDVKLSVAYQPNQPLSMQDWMHKENPTALINAGYFDGQNNATGLVVPNGQAFGTSDPDFGGMLAVDAQGTVQLRPLGNQPTHPPAG